MNTPDVNMIVEPNLVMDLLGGKGLHIDPQAPWRLAVWTELTKDRPHQTPVRTQRDARVAGGKRAEALGWTVAWDRDPTRPRTLRARWVAPVRAA